MSDPLELFFDMDKLKDLKVQPMEWDVNEFPPKEEPEFIVEYILISRRIARIRADDKVAAVHQVKEWHSQLNYDRDGLDAILVQKVEGPE